MANFITRPPPSDNLELKYEVSVYKKMVEYLISEVYIQQNKSDIQVFENVNGDVYFTSL